ncbi:MAG: response regulator [Chitinophagales bacterium]|nr:response regulator [Chitinophagales bacterium]
MFHIGLIEDNPSEKLLFEIAVDELEFSEDETISIFEDDKQLLEYLDRNGRFDLLLLDVNIGSISGFDILKLLKGMQVKFPIVMYSNSNNPDDLERSRVLKAEAYIQKPYDFEQLKDLLQNFQAHINNDTLLPFLQNESFIRKYGRAQ